MSSFFISPASALEPTDEYYNQQFNLHSIQMDKAWDYTVGSPDVIIAVIDSGVDIHHPDLANNIWRNYKEIQNNGIDDDNNGYIDDYYGWDFVENNNDPSPKFDDSYSFLGMNHGTIIAGILASQGGNDIGIAGVSWSSKIMSLRVLASDGTGTTDNVARAIDYARLNGADIINLSFVGEGKSQALEDAIKRAYKAGLIIVAAAGNEVDHGIDMTENPRYPVCHDGPNGENWVIGVASVDKNDQLASFSNYGDCVDIVAPGVGIFSTLFTTEKDYKYNQAYGGYWSGTSISTPHISGLAALVKSLKPTLSSFEIQNLILSNTDNIDQKNLLYAGKMGQGKVNALKVMMATDKYTGKAEAGIDKIITGPVGQGGPHIRTFKGAELNTQFFGFETNKNFGANVIAHDLNGDGAEDIIVSGAKGEEPWIKIFDLKGNLKTKFLAFEAGFKGGVYAAAGDVDNDGRDEIVVVPQSSYGPLVRVFNQTGGLKQEFYGFNKLFQGGLTVAVGDVNQDNFNDIIIGIGRNGPSSVKIFNYQGLLLNEFMAYDPKYMAGISLALGDVDGDNVDEIITGAKAGGGPQVKVFNFHGTLLNQFMAYDPNFRGGVNVAAGDINGNGIDEIITGAGPGGGPHVRIFGAGNQVLGQFMAYAENFRGGVNVASGK